MKYKLPDKDPNETNEEWCSRAANSIPPENIVRAYVAHLIQKAPKRGIPPWAEMADLLNHGSGVSQAIIELYSPTEEK